MPPATPQSERDDPVVIVGIAARIPGASTSMEFWDLLENARSARSKVPHDRFNVDAFYHPDPDRADSSNVRHGHFLSGDIGHFDAPFFTIQPNEAISMDPQQRLVLETSYHALENAGISMESVAGSHTGVYIGTSSRDFESILTSDAEQPSKYIGTGIGTSLIPNRVSWFFDFRGPSLAIDTGCSGSLVALHQACEAIKAGDVDAALVGGVSLIISPDVSLVHLSNMGFFSPDGYCFSFDERANGYSKGEGVAMVVLKRLSDATRDGNIVRAIIRGSSCNQDGHTPGITMPSLDAQVDNIRRAYDRAGLDLESTAYFEAHGTGTQVGDTVEAEAIQRVFQRPPQNPLYIGALKSNIGHLEAASGVAGLIKAVLVLEHGVIPPNINFKTANPAIDLTKWGLKFPLRPTPWPVDGLRRLSLNSFGYGGTNAHVVLDDAASYLHMRQLEGLHNTSVSGAGEIQERSMDSPERNTSYSAKLEPRILVFSAADETSLKTILGAYQTYFSSLDTPRLIDPNAFIDALSSTLAKHRSKLPWKAFVIVRTVEDLQNSFGKRVLAPVRSSRPVGLHMVFNGQGAQYAQMGQELLQYPVYNESIIHADKVLNTLGCKWSLLTELSKDKAETRINEPLYSQPSCTALQLALLDLLASWDIFPSMVVGHSSGEIAAAYAAGALSFEEALKVAYFRGVVASKLANNPSVQGAMSSIALSSEAIRPSLEEVNARSGSVQVEIGCVNSDKNVTVTGDSQAIDILNRKMESGGIFARKLAVTVAYHSIFMGVVAMEYLFRMRSHVVSSEVRSDRAARMFSSVLGREIQIDQLRQPEYWVQNLTTKVLFLNAVSEMVSAAAASYQGAPNQILEVGPHSVLQRPIKDILAYLKQEKKFEYESLLTRGESAVETTLNSIGRLYCKNAVTDVSKVRSQPAKTGGYLLDLPSYPFNHSTKYWHEGRISRNYRFKKYPRHDFVGNQVADWNRLEPRWRNMVRLSEQPWLKDHVIQGKIIYPTAALLVMALEALRQLHDYNAEQLKGAEICDVSLPNPLVIPESGQIETQITLRPNGGSYTFSIYAFQQGEATKICHGKMSACSEYVERDSNETSDLKRFEDKQKRCNERVDASQYYASLAEMGYDFGCELRKIPFVQYNDARFAAAQIHFNQRKPGYESGISHDYIIHPADLEVFLQMSLAAVSGGGTVTTPVLHPISLGRFWINNKHALSSDGPARTIAQVTSHGMFDAEFSLFATNAAGTPILEIEGLCQKAEKALNGISDAPVRPLAYQISWKPDPDLLSGAEVKWVIQESIPSSEAPSGEDEDFQELISYHYVGVALRELGDKTENMPPHLQKYMAWAKHIFKQNSYERLLKLFPDFANEETREEYETAQARRGFAMELHVETGRWLLPILRGEGDALDLLFKSGLADRYYGNELFATNYKMLASYIDLLAHKNPELKVLEIGAGTGGATRPIIKVLSSENPNTGISRFHEYMYTDISPAFFEKARDMFAPHVGRMKFQVLDIEKNVLSQNFEAKYDAVICSGVLHISASMEATLRNVRQLLKPGGKLVQFEPSNPGTCRNGFTFGLLRDWWVSTEEHRKHSPLISDEMWNKTLMECGFSGTEVCIPTFPQKERQTHSIFISTRTMDDRPASSAGPLNHLTICLDEGRELQRQVAHQLENSLRSRFPACTTSSFQDLASQDIGDNAWYIFLLELERPFLCQIEESGWELLKKIMDGAKQIVWVTRGGGPRSVNPEMSIVTGFGRSMMTEKLGLHFIELALAADSDASHSAERLQQVVLNRLEGGSEPEFAEDNGRLCIGRLVTAGTINERLHGQLVKQKPVEERLSVGKNAERALRVAVTDPGDFGSLYFTYSTVFDRPLGPDEVMIKVEAAVVNVTDVQVALGHQSGTGFGLECAGVVTKVGSGAGFDMGDRVCAFVGGGGGLATFVRVSTSAVMKIPDDMAFSQAAGLAEATLMAYYSLTKVARLQEGESVLVAPGGSAVGRAAIQIATQCGSAVYATARDEVEQADLVEGYGLPVEHVILIRPRFGSEVLRASNGGVDVVLGGFLLGEANAQSEAARCLVSFGRFVDLEASSKPSSSSSSSSPRLARNCMYASVDATQLLVASSTKEDSKRLGLLGGFKAGRDLTELRVFGPDQLAEAFAHVRDSPSQDSKAIVTFVDADASEDAGDGKIVKIVPQPTPPCVFSPEATYVIGGGNGGLGRAIAHWLADGGARHILILARSGANSRAAQALVADLTARRVDIRAPPCDLADADAVQHVLGDAAKTMPPIKGLIQATMVLREGILQNLSSADWHAALAPKVQGTWNLHALLPRNLDFFVTLSSVAGITGCRSQASYNAACTYQDALARYRHSLGERAVSFDLGVIIGVGYAAEKDQTDMLRREGYLGMPKKEFLAILDYCCDPNVQIATPQQTQVVAGLGYMEKYKPGDRGEEEVYWVRNAICAVVRQMNAFISSSPDAASTSEAVRAGELLAIAESDAEAAEIALDALMGKLSRLLSIPTVDIDASMPIFAVGIDSLVALEVRYWFMKELKADVKVSEIMKGRALGELAAIAAERSEWRTAVAA